MEQFIKEHRLRDAGYLSDGVYIGRDPSGGLMLFTERRENGINWMVLDGYCLAALERYMQRLAAEQT